MTVLTDGGARHCGVVLFNVVLLSVPFEGVDGHPWSVSSIIYVINCLIFYILNVTLDSIVI